MKKKLIIVLCSLVAAVTLVVVSVLGTVAYLTSSAAVSNVFTIGNVGIIMDESKVDQDGHVISGGGRVDTNTYKLVPNKKYTKDPVITVNAGSTPSWLFVLVRNDIEKIEIVSDDGDKMTIAEQMLANGWKVYTTASTGKVYVYCGTNTELTPKAVGSVDEEKYKLFDYFYLDPNANVSAYGAAKVTLTAVAIQSDGFNDDPVGTENAKTALDKAWAAVVATYPYIHTGTGSGN
jgi:predicted ribosomally synthesized peptide with SipW-like signal peptide